MTASKGLRQHLLGTAHKLELEEKNGKSYKKGSPTPLTEEEIEKHDDAIDLYQQREAQVHEFIYGTVDPSTSMQIEVETAAEVWKNLVAIHTTKGDMFQTDILNKLQTIRHTEGDDMRVHLNSMCTLRKQLAETGAKITDDSFNTYICTSLSLCTHF